MYKWCKNCVQQVIKLVEIQWGSFHLAYVAYEENGAKIATTVNNYGVLPRFPHYTHSVLSTVVLRNFNPLHSRFYTVSTRLITITTI